ncbi:hypothetical protein DKG77_08610 [Flagellimonas aquimarina]|jgi:hypothetical protein|uniref:Uncharacterized protein n=1 Tax=Flagellimonas aquimarina TaxID=2201895 RepID=A0A316KVQ9_9FLAO|nr:hypothetical protein [Allomuricauda koreensis]PWL38327.1 hypothetical protein DKG77_08610 [Allomuricauda koreensis]
MRKLSLPILLMLVLSCSDGDLQIETIDFDNVLPQSCNDLEASSTNVLFKINVDEALILDLQSSVLNNGVVGETVTTESTVPGQTSITYRIFSGDVSNNYFCDEIPPVTPTVVQEIVAEDGLVTVQTTADADSTNFVHTISLSGVSFVTAAGERITNLTIDEFGEVTTVIPN